MPLDKKASKLKDEFIELLIEYNIDCNITRDRLEFFLWELKFLDIFLGPQSSVFLDECGLLHKMQQIWMTLHDIYFGPEEAADAYHDEFIYTARRDEFIDPKTDPFPFHVPTEIWKTKMEFRANYSFPKISLPLDPANKDGGVATSKLVLDLVDSTVRILGDIVEVDARWSLFYLPGLKEQIEEVLEELNLLKFFVSFVSNKCIEPQIRHTFFTHVLTVASYAAMVVWLYLPSQYDRENQQAAPSHEMNVLLSDILQMKIKPIQPNIRKIYTDVLQALKSTIQPGWHPNTVADGCSVETLAQNLVEPPAVGNSREMLSLLRANLINLPVLDRDFHLQDMDTVIVDAGLLIYSLYDSEWEKEGVRFEDVNRALGLDLPSNIQPIKAMIYLIIRKAFQSNLPRIHGYGFVDFLLKNLKEFQSRHADQLASARNQLQIIEKEFQSLQTFLQAVVEKKQYSKLETLADCSMISKAYEVEYVIGACISKDVPHWCLERWLLDITAEIIGINATIQEKNMVEHTIKNGTARTSSQLDRTPRTNKEIVGFEDVIENLRDKLLKGTKGQDVISIHGMPGQGKTTLACRLYSDKSVISQYDIRAQCCVSQVYSYKDLLLALLRDAIGENSQRREKDADELADMLRKALLPKRYLILVDDVWETSVWDDLKGCFPDVNNRSRVILTTRHHEVAKYASVHSDPLRLRMLNEDESWELLEKEVFGEESCSPHLMDVGKRIAKMCGRLPLSVALVGGILKEMEEKEDCWEKIAADLGSHIHGGSKGVIEQSYQNLPYHLRSCFIYFAAFSEDEVIKISKLTRLWISEGFVISCGDNSNLEDTAEEYLENLIGRNLVMAAKRSYSDGKIEACRLHDVLLDFCKAQATEENLLLWIKRDQNTSPSSRVYSHKQLAQRRLVFSKLEDLYEWRSSCSLVCSVSLKENIKTRSLFIQNFKFLKVLDLQNITLHDWFLTELIYLRYLCVATDKDLAPSSMDNLWNLETLILNSGRLWELLVPVAVWKMVNLRHLHVFKFHMENEELFADSSELYDLKSLSAPWFSCVKDAELMLRKTPNLRELRCGFDGSRGPFPVLDFPISLEALHITFEHNDDQSFPVRISAPNLKKLILCDFELGLEHLSNIAMLPKLEVLELIWVKFDNDEWEVSNDEFAQLKFLKIVYQEFKEWTVSDDAFPNLKCLVLSACENLKEIPSCFGEISSLNSIEVENCSESVEKSAQDIREMQVEDYQNTDFKLVIKN